MMPGQKLAAVLIIFTSVWLSACGTKPITPTTSPVIETPIPATAIAEPSLTPVPVSAFESGQYRNLFKDYLDKSDAEIQERIDQAFQQLFYGDDASERVYYPVEPDMAYILDTGNNDVRSEGMSYGMMIAVQMDKKEEFDRIWKWTKTYMYQVNGGYKGYFAWHCKTDGAKIDQNPASDGEVWFITALFFADARWGSGEGIHNYRAEAQSILDVALHPEELGGKSSTPLFNLKNKQVVFVPSKDGNALFTDPSYHMPHYYELWARWADKDNQFWQEAAQTSRAYWPASVNPKTGLAPNYSTFSGAPVHDSYHSKFRYDAFRVGANVGMDYLWFLPQGGVWHTEQANRLLTFFASQGIQDYKAEYTLEGKALVAHRSTGLIATNAVLAHAADPEIGKPFVQAFWDTPLPTGQYRYYDGLLYMLGLLQASGNFRIYQPVTLVQTDLSIIAKFIPLSGQTLLLIGQDTDSFDEYVSAVGQPGGFSEYTSLKNLEGLTRPTDYGSGPHYLVYLAEKYPGGIINLGLYLVNTLEAVSNGVLDDETDKLLDVLTATNRPVFLRFGYEFDGSWNHYQPEAFVRAWKHFRSRMQEKGVTNVVMVWHSAAFCGSTFSGYPIEDWYPGDDQVDWIGLSYFTQPQDCAGEPLEEVLSFARAHSKPVLVAESTPQRYSISNLTYSTNGREFSPRTPDQIWEEWYSPYFDFIHRNSDSIRAVTYINANWDSQSMWAAPYANGYWGDSRVQASDFIKQHWLEEIQTDFWFTFLPKKTTNHKIFPALVVQARQCV